METAELNEKQRRYVESVASGMDSRAAAMAAGYSDSYAKVAHTRMMKVPVVAKAIEAIRTEGRSRAAYTLATAMDEANRALAFSVRHKNPMAMVKATELRAKLSGLLIEKIHIEAVDVRGALEEARARLRTVNPRVLDVLPIGDCPDDDCDPFGN